MTLTPTPSIWQWSCHYLFLRLRSVATGVRTQNLSLAHAGIECYAVFKNQNLIRNETNIIFRLVNINNITALYMTTISMIKR